jgi:hypothetical protein
MAYKNIDDAKKNAKEYREKNKEKNKKYQDEYRQLHGKELNAKRKGYIDDYNNRPEVKEKRRLQRLARKDIRNKMLMDRYHKDTNYRIVVNMRTRMGHALRKYNDFKKDFKTLDILGCTIEELIKHLEAQFKDRMSWENYGFGNDKWNIDHIIPCSSFDLTDPEQQKKCFHYTNLQPLWQLDNISKGAKVPSEFPCENSPNSLK